ncbi:hypothetical protein [Roseospira goensis]|uniref:Uncharacterized protein n=1 Tax=Roseospira goensis TaxID=391922 RepID=A0A7W6WL47_9PROT|nr:hypothetical protein [Roseospira goensis]MBB4286037.1 hypothetical protein [Roseospira goensis]
MYPTVWVVTRVIRSPGVPTHYMLTDTDGRNEVRTISEPTLVDTAYYFPIDPPAAPDPVPAEGGGPARTQFQGRGETSRTDTARADCGDGETRGWLNDLGLDGARAPGASRAR